MKKITKIAAGAALALLVVAAGTPALAACGSAFLLQNTGQVEIQGAGGAYVGGATIPSFTANAKVDFWSLSTGNPVIGAGDDNGAFDPGIAGIAPYDYGNGTFYNYATYIFSNWAAAANIDGCVTNAGVPGQNWTCMLVTDTYGDIGYTAVLGDQSDAGGNFDFGGGPTVMVPIPKPSLVSTAKNGSGVDVTVSSPVVSGGVYGPAGALCEPVGYKVYSLEVLEGALPPSTRDKSQWTLASAELAIGSGTTVTAACDSFPAVDLYVATSLVYPDGFETPWVSVNSLRIGCGVATTYAEPLDRPRVKPGDPLTPRSDRGGRRGR